MSLVTLKRAAVVLVAAGAVLGSGSAAFANAGAAGAAIGSPGAGSGNQVQVPVSVPVNVCGNTVTVVGALNPTLGNRCVNHDMPGAVAKGAALHSPGFLSGNLVQVPVDVPVNATGNSVTGIGGLNPALGNSSAN
ncbi:hypothetical protein BIV57_14375 [Mangrovactinospora gilvigrisea]|uniref:Chaplin domain-containing protein n=1 Tax=Mangrovactinospora gilvigrisea TaxID=1428644 RepID=A0A1J7C5F8_9ACTN|nr:hypothetical protein BIV57_14375 [Mangrovactinospora gilvigrisea]